MGSKTFTRGLFHLGLQEPRLLLDLPDAVVFQKPSGYQIDDRGRGADPEAPEDRGNAALFLDAWRDQVRVIWGHEPVGPWRPRMSKSKNGG